MADTFSKQFRSEVMRAVRSHGNRSTEMKMIAIFKSHAITGWRRHQPLPGKPDFVFRKERLAVFIDGCFWHNCPKHLRVPASNIAYWQAKLERNRVRDRKVNAALRTSDWTVVRIWEHSLAEPKRVAARLLRELETRRRSPTSASAPGKSGILPAQTPAPATMQSGRPATTARETWSAPLNKHNRPR